MLNASRKRFDLILSNILTFHPESDLIIDQKRDTRILFVDGKEIAMTNSEINLTGKRSGLNPFGSGVVASVKQSFNRYIVNHMGEMQPDKTGEYTFPAVEHKYSPIYTNKLIYNSIGDLEVFYMLDLKHAYWRIAYLLGYINEKMYKKHVDNDESKLCRNVALACVIAHRKRTYFKNGEPYMEISEVCLPLETMYANIRHICWNAIGEVQKTLSQEVFACRTDAVYVTEAGLEKARKMLYNKGFLVRTMKCIKINEDHFATETDQIKKF